MLANEERALKLLFNHEGGFVNHPKDPGGATNHGITIGTLRVARGRPVTIADVRALTKEEAKEIYRRMYLRPVGFNDLPSGLDFAVADFGVNSGPARAVKELQRLVGSAPDGVWGDKTSGKIDDYIKAFGLDRLIIDYCNARMKFLRGLTTWSTFGRGWTRRVTGIDPKGEYPKQLGVQGEALAMANWKVPKGIDPAPSIEMAKARDVDRKLTATATGKAAVTNITGAVATGAGQTLQWLATSGTEVGSAISSYGEVFEYLKYTGIAITIGGIIAASVIAANKNREAGVDA